MIYEICFTNGAPNIFIAGDEANKNYQRGDTVAVRMNRSLYSAEIYRLFSDELDLDLTEEASIERLLTAEDERQKEKIQADSEQAKNFVRDLVGELNLEMKIVKVSYALDYSSLFISFTADKRVDFRQLLRELSGHFQTKIELRQIGVRDAARLTGGLGPCGRPLCCSHFLYGFPNVSIKMVKTQQLGFNQDKINGMCGRLMCCLSYENDFYKQAAKEFPDYGERLETPEGQGKVIDINILRRTITLRFTDFVREYTLSELKLEKTNG